LAFALGIAAMALWTTGCGQGSVAPDTRARGTNPASAVNTRASVTPGATNPLQQAESPGARPAFRLLRYELKMEPSELRALERNPESNETHPATFIADGVVHEGVQVRFRGEWARSWPKKPFKIFFPRDKPFHGHHSINLNSAWRDASFIRETLAYHVYAACGSPGSQSRLVHLEVNGQFRGVYVEVEQVDKTLLRRLGLKGAALFKAISDENGADERDYGNDAAFRTHYENETDAAEGLGELQRFVHELAVTTNATAFFERRLEIDKYINYLAATALIQHWDGFNKNHFVVYDRRGSSRWLVLPWDLDRTFGDHWNHSFDHAELPVLLGMRAHPGVTGWNRLQDRFLKVPSLRARFEQRLAHLLETEFTPAKLFPLLDEWEAALGEAATQDRRRWRGANESLHAGITGVKRFIEQRRAFLKAELKR
jgi:spore coat protein H